MAGRAGARARARSLNWFPNRPGGEDQLWWVEFDGDSALINCGQDASLQDLHGFAGFTIDGWIMVPDEQLAHYGTIASKHDNLQEVPYGWYFVVDYDTGDLAGAAIYSTVVANSATVETITPAVWYHVLMCFNPVDAKIYMAIDGAWCTYANQVAAVGVIGTDAGIDFLMGAMHLNGDPTMWLRGGIQWLRLSLGVRYEIGVPFPPPETCAAPAVDGTTVELWALDEGVGAVTAASVVPANQGAMTDCAWHACVE